MYKPEREKEILAFWKENKIFEKSLEQTREGSPFVFYDGPPFATGLPHFGSLLPSTIKDIIPRYQTMKGRYVARKWGWDCHGLPVENLIEKELGLKTKKDIIDFGIDKFNKAARDSVLRYASDWKEIIPRLGRWVDMDNDYRTMDAEYTSGVWDVFSQLNQKGLVYEGFKSMHICPRCETTLSNFEVNQGYKDITDISVFVKFKVKGEKDTFFLAWTTTPWTLPGNMALAVGVDTEYVKVKIKDEKDEFLILAKSRLETSLKTHEYKIVEEMKGSDLVGKHYVPVFDTYEEVDIPNKENIWRVWAGEFVTDADGTGLVHIAPGFGDDDLKLAQTNNIPFVQHVLMNGSIKPEVKELAGLQAKPRDDHQSTDIEVIKYLAGKELLFAKEKIIHSYPHCWRCNTPLLNFATTSWFVKVPDIRDEIVAANKKVNWVPEAIGENRFGDWLEGARDWSVSRARFWGAPIPIWRSEDGKILECVNSVDDLRSKTKRNDYKLLRHGEAEHNVKEIFSSSLNSPYHVTEKGKEQVKRSLDGVSAEDFDIVYASPLLRTKETAEIFKEVTGYKGEVIFDNRLREFEVGDFEERPRLDFVAFYEKGEMNKDVIDQFFPNGENYKGIRDRVSEFIYEIDKKHQGKKILIISHEGVFKMLQSVALGGRKDDLNNVWRAEPISTGSLHDLNFSALPKNELNELDLHRPFIDDVVLYSGDVPLKRVTDVFDCWFESGSMPFASGHLPFPADFIAEGLDQTRGWFYSLIVLGTALKGESPYKNVLVNGLILAEDGRKMSKSLNNYPPLTPTLDEYGADSLRYFLASSPSVKAEDTNFSAKSLDEVVKKHFNRLFNIVSLYEMFAEGEIPQVSSDNVLDKWILARLAELHTTVSSNLDSFQLDRATRPFGDFIDDLSVWYIRRSRDRFKSEDLKERNDALGTTKFVLSEFAKLIAPFTPFLAEDLYGKMSGEKESVHLEKWPEYMNREEGKLILDRMAEVRKIVSMALEARAKAGLKVRQPLARLIIREDKFDIADNAEYSELIKDEVNIKEVVLDGAISGEVELDINLTPELIKEGISRDLMRFIQDMRKKAGLSPKEAIALTVETNDAGKEIIEQFQEEIKGVAKIADFLFEDLVEGDVLETESFAFKFSLKKI